MSYNRVTIGKLCTSLALSLSYWSSLSVLRPQPNPNLECWQSKVSGKEGWLGYDTLLYLNKILFKFRVKVRGEGKEGLGGPWGWHC